MRRLTVGLIGMAVLLESLFFAPAFGEWSLPDCWARPGRRRHSWLGRPGSRPRSGWWWRLPPKPVTPMRAFVFGGRSGNLTLHLRITALDP
jgi:hypothetical protein